MFRPRSRATLAFVLFTLPVLALAAPPAAPSVTVGAGYKQFSFDFEPVSGASYYQIWFRANGATDWVKYMEHTASTTGFKVTVSGHLLDWFNARYYVTACNSSGCSRTADIYVTSLMKETVGYIKPRDTIIDPIGYGMNVALSADGSTLAVLEGEMRGTRQNSASVMVYRKYSSGWHQEARLEGKPVEEDTLSANQQTLAISGDGSVVVFGLPNQYISGNPKSKQGAAFVYRRSSAGLWALEQQFQTPLNKSWQYGKQVDIDDAGDTIAIWKGGVEIYKHGSAGWTLSTVVQSPPDSGDCDGLSLSGDGKILVRTCVGLYPHAPGEIWELQGNDFVLRQTLERGIASPLVDTSYDGSLVVVATNGGDPPADGSYVPWVSVFRRNGAQWQLEPPFTYVGGRATKPPDNFYGNALAISRDGRFIAVGSEADSNAGSGVVRGPLTRTSTRDGAVLVFQRKPTSWSLRNMIKPNVPSNGMAYGYSVAFGDDGKLLAVGSPYEDSGARGIDGDQTDTSSPDSGAVWLY